MPLLAHSNIISTAFIEKKMNKFVEPTRKGVPKGNLIGFPRKKYHAAILCAIKKKYKLLEIIKEINDNISYILMKKWHSEKQFKNIVEKFKEDFQLFIVNL